MNVSSNFVSADFGIITISSFRKLRISRFRKSKFSKRDNPVLQVRLDRKNISAIFIMLEVIKISTYDTKQSYLNCYYVEQS